MKVVKKITNVLFVINHIFMHSLKKHIRNIDYDNENISKTKIQIKEDTVHDGEKVHKCSVCGKSFT